jgi:rfaE bifunctional protein kinase chain/domain
MMARASVETLHPSDWNKPRLRELLGLLAGKRILVIGDVGVDRYTIGTVERISPEAPVPVVFVQDEKLKLGLAANVADNVKTLGGVPLLLGVVGRDRCAEDFRKLLKTSRIDSSNLVTEPSRRTVLKERVVSERQQLLRVDYETLKPIEAQTEQQILRRARALARQADAVIVEDYAKGMLSVPFARAIYAAARRAGRIVAADPNSKSPSAMYRGVTVLTPNTKEAERLAGIAIVDEGSLLRAGRALLKATAARHLVITRGKEGMAIFSAREPRVRLIPTYAREVYDVSGAGDTVISVLALGLSAGATIEEACILGNLAAGVEVGKRGTATVTPDEIEVAMEFFASVGV